jgi:hypothetical protein
LLDTDTLHAHNVNTAADRRIGPEKDRHHLND